MSRKVVAQLVERYAKNRDQYRSSAYNEETTRNEFIGPLFEALGWDIQNRSGAAEQYKDVIHEEGIRVGGSTKAPDYTFRLNGTRKFFVEAKRPSVDLKNDPGPALQLRRYAWTAHLPLSVLTDFEEFAVYDARIKPAERDKPSVARVLYFTFDELPERLDHIWSIFSKDAVSAGSFDRYAEDVLGKRGTSEVDAEFLRELEEWRKDLARTFALRNPDLGVDELNYAVQTTIDRLIFLRIAEGRGVEPYGQLAQLKGAGNTYAALITLCNRADLRYNSGLFDFRTDTLTPHLALDDKALNGILDRLYYPECPYEFAVLPAAILGNVYEQFLGKVIRLTAGHQARVEEKPEVKKAGGVFYTPSYVVDYIVDRTLRPLTDAKGPRQLAQFRVLDPACGSGSFLIAAYQFLLDRHLEWYQCHQPQKRTNEVYRTPSGYRLTTAEKRRILLNSIYGVDIDRQAVEVTKLSLLLKVLEGESDQTISQQVLFGERALPSLEQNIRCGNSLVSTDVVTERLAADADLQLDRVRPFDWHQEFAVVFAGGGFDAVLGNPPYVYRNATEDALRPYYDTHYACTQGNYDLYKFFVERSMSLVASMGSVGMIVSASFLVQPSFARLRELLLTRSIELLAPLGPGVFPRATVDTTVLILRNEPPKPKRRLAVVAPGRPQLISMTPEYRVTQARFAGNAGFAFDYRLTDAAAALVDRLHRDFPAIETGFSFGVGINTGFIREELVSLSRKDARYHRMVPGGGIARYGAVRPSGWIMYDPDYVRARGKLGRSLPPPEYFDNEKILVVRTRNLSLPVRIVATLDGQGLYNLNRLSNIIARPGFSLVGLLGVLNSSVMNWLFSTRYLDYEVKPVYLRSCPMPDVNAPVLLRAVSAVLAAHRAMEQARTPTALEALRSEICALENSVDEIVEGLFGLSVSERRFCDPYRVAGATVQLGARSRKQADAEVGKGRAG